MSGSNKNLKDASELTNNLPIDEEDEIASGLFFGWELSPQQDNVSPNFRRESFDYSATPSSPTISINPLDSILPSQISTSIEYGSIDSQFFGLTANINNEAPDGFDEFKENQLSDSYRFLNELQDGYGISENNVIDSLQKPEIVIKKFNDQVNKSNELKKLRYLKVKLNNKKFKDELSRLVNFIYANHLDINVEDLITLLRIQNNHNKMVNTIMHHYINFRRFFSKSSFINIITGGPKNQNNADSIVTLMENLEFLKTKFSEAQIEMMAAHPSASHNLATAVKYYALCTEKNLTSSDIAVLLNGPRGAEKVLKPLLTNYDEFDKQIGVENIVSMARKKHLQTIMLLNVMINHPSEFKHLTNTQKIGFVDEFLKLSAWDEKKIKEWIAQWNHINFIEPHDMELGISDTQTSAIQNQLDLCEDNTLYQEDFFDKNLENQTELKSEDFNLALQQLSDTQEIDTSRSQEAELFQQSEITNTTENVQEIIKNFKDYVLIGHGSEIQRKIIEENFLKKSFQITLNKIANYIFIHQLDLTTDDLIAILSIKNGYKKIPKALTFYRRFVNIFSKEAFIDVLTVKNSNICGAQNIDSIMENFNNLKNKFSLKDIIMIAQHKHGDTNIEMAVKFYDFLIAKNITKDDIVTLLNGSNRGKRVLSNLVENYDILEKTIGIKTIINIAEKNQYTTSSFLNIILNDITEFKYLTEPQKSILVQKAQYNSHQKEKEFKTWIKKWIADDFKVTIDKENIVTEIDFETILNSDLIDSRSSKVLIENFKDYVIKNQCSSTLTKYLKNNLINKTICNKLIELSNYISNNPLVDLDIQDLTTLMSIRQGFKNIVDTIIQHYTSYKKVFSKSSFIKIISGTKFNSGFNIITSIMKNLEFLKQNFSEDQIEKIAAHLRGDKNIISVVNNYDSCKIRNLSSSDIATLLNGPDREKDVLGPLLENYDELDRLIGISKIIDIADYHRDLKTDYLIVIINYLDTIKFLNENQVTILLQTAKQKRTNLDEHFKKLISRWNSDNFTTSNVDMDLDNSTNATPSGWIINIQESDRSSRNDCIDHDESDLDVRFSSAFIDIPCYSLNNLLESDYERLLRLNFNDKEIQIILAQSNQTNHIIGLLEKSHQALKSNFSNHEITKIINVWSGAYDNLLKTISYSTEFLKFGFTPSQFIQIITCGSEKIGSGENILSIIDNIEKLRLLRLTNSEISAVAAHSMGYLNIAALAYYYKDLVYSQRITHKEIIELISGTNRSELLSLLSDNYKYIKDVIGIKNLLKIIPIKKDTSSEFLNLILDMQDVLPALGFVDKLTLTHNIQYNDIDSFKSWIVEWVKKLNKSRSTKKRMHNNIDSPIKKRKANNSHQTSTTNNSKCNKLNDEQTTSLIPDQRNEMPTNSLIDPPFDSYQPSYDENIEEPTLCRDESPDALKNAEIKAATITIKSPIPYEEISLDDLMDTNDDDLKHDESYESQTSSDNRTTEHQIFKATVISDKNSAKLTCEEKINDEKLHNQILMTKDNSISEILASNDDYSTKAQRIIENFNEYINLNKKSDPRIKIIATKNKTQDFKVYLSTLLNHIILKSIPIDLEDIITLMGVRYGFKDNIITFINHYEDFIKIFNKQDFFHVLTCGGKNHAGGKIINHIMMHKVILKDKCKLSNDEIIKIAAHPGGSENIIELVKCYEFFSKRNFEHEEIIKVVSSSHRGKNFLAPFKANYENLDKSLGATNIMYLGKTTSDRSYKFLLTILNNLDEINKLNLTQEQIKDFVGIAQRDDTKSFKFEEWLKAWIQAIRIINITNPEIIILNFNEYIKSYQTNSNQPVNIKNILPKLTKSGFKEQLSKLAIFISQNSLNLGSDELAEILGTANGYKSNVDVFIKHYKDFIQTFSKKDFILVLTSGFKNYSGASGIKSIMKNLSELRKILTIDGIIQLASHPKGGENIEKLSDSYEFLINKGISHFDILALFDFSYRGERVVAPLISNFDKFELVIGVKNIIKIAKNNQHHESNFLLTILNHIDSINSLRLTPNQIEVLVYKASFNDDTNYKAFKIWLENSVKNGFPDKTIEPNHTGENFKEHLTRPSNLSQIVKLTGESRSLPILGIFTTKESKNSPNNKHSTSSNSINLSNRRTS